jgi:predicted MPP superfamily phosphohydrolase/Mn-dependent DtxR family transcriptional regulator
MNRDKEMELVEKLYNILSKKRRGSISQLSNELGVSKYQLLNIADYIRFLDNSKRVYISRRDELKLADKSFSSKDYIPVDEKLRKFVVGLASEAHIGSNYSSANLLGAAWKVFDSYDTNLIIFAGDLFVGKEYKRKSGEVLVKSPYDQIELARRILPRSSVGLKTHVVAGSQDVLYERGRTINLVQELGKVRRDVVPEGVGIHKFPIYDTNVEIIVENPVTHEKDPVGKTYDIQRRMENLEVEKGKKVILTVGGYHLFAAIPYRNGIVYGLLLPSLISQTPSLARKNINPVIGVVLVELSLGRKNDENDVRYLQDARVKFFPLKEYWREKDFIKEPNYNGLSEFEKRTLSIIYRGGECSVGELSRELGISKNRVMELMSNLEKKQNGSNSKIIYDEVTDKYLYNYRDFIDHSIAPTKMDFGEENLKIMAISDTHLNSKYQNSKLLNELYSIAEEKNVDIITHPGDITDGVPSSGYRGHRFDNVIQDVSTLIDYVVDVYPRSKIPTYMISGNHDQWSKKDIGLDIGREISKRRGDLIYLGEGFGVINERGILIALHHPDKGAPYTLGYDIIKFSRYLKRFGDFKLILFGNYHKATVLVDNDRIGVLVPTLKSPDSYFITKGLPDWIGAWEIGLGITNGNIKRVEILYVNLENKIDPSDYKQIYDWLKEHEETPLERIYRQKEHQEKIEFRRKEQKKPVTLEDFL